MRRLLATLAAAITVALWPASVSASHTHVRVLADGRCVVLAAAGHEDDVVLPDPVFASNPNVQSGVAYPDGRRHPLHVLVHIAGNGAGELLVLGSAAAVATCDGYVND